MDLIMLHKDLMQQKQFYPRVQKVERLPKIHVPKNKLLLKNGFRVA
jgi:hypothetical protein